MKAAPSALVPGTATKTDPGRTLRLSAVTPETVRPACSDARASGKRSARVVNEAVLPPQAPLRPLPPCGGELERGGAGRRTPAFQEREDLSWSTRTERLSAPALFRSVGVPCPAPPLS